MRIENKSWENARESLFDIDSNKASFSKIDAGFYDLSIGYIKDRQLLFKKIDFSKAFQNKAYLTSVEFDRFLLAQLGIKDIKQVRSIALHPRPCPGYFRDKNGYLTKDKAKAAEPGKMTCFLLQDYTINIVR